MKNEDFEKALFESYLDSIEDKFDFEVDTIEIEDLTNESGEAKIIIKDKDIIEPLDTQVLGTIRQLSHKGKLINYVPVELQENGLYLVMKASSFVHYALNIDIIALGYSGKYLIDPYNNFLLYPEEIENSVLLDYLDTFSVLQLQEALKNSLTEKQEGKRIMYSDITESWKLEFRIKEYQLTSYFRFRNLNVNSVDLTTIVDLLMKKEELSINKYAAARPTLTEAFDLMKQPKSSNIFYALNHTLVRESDARVLIYPDDEYIGKAGKIYICSECVFDGYIPKKLCLGVIAFKDLISIQEVLNIRIEIEEE
ncbi:MAG: hypothetical protein WC179_06845 [Candidatus Cloacimonadaceae bacterium]|jgi:hypothetical protein|nr:hypothetical protein [Candidatus Cloacimonadota bacterium]MDY0112533.1 hypothetical protein [Candidatus Syntrophosphaera sp.]